MNQILRAPDLSATTETTVGSRVGDTVYLAALDGLSGAGVGVERPGIEEQSRVIFQRASRALQALGAGLSDVVQGRFYVTDWRYLQPLNAVYAEFFDAPYTARTTVRSASLSSPHALVEAYFVGVAGGQNRVLGHDDLFKLPVPLAQSGVQGGDRFFSTGLLGVDQQLRAPATIGAQMERALENQSLALESAGLELDDVIKVNLFPRDSRHLEGMLAAYDGFFHSPYPALSISVTTLARPEWLVEIELIAAAGEKIALVAPGAPEGARAGWTTRRVQTLPPADQAESAAVFCDGWLYTGALMGYDSDGLAVAGIEAQAASQMEQMKTILESVGCSLADVVFASSSVTDWRNAAAFQAAWKSGLSEPSPPASLVEALTVHPDLSGQIEVLARQGAGASATLLLAD